jgi:hypothetical protein
MPTPLHLAADQQPSNNARVRQKSAPSGGLATDNYSMEPEERTL